MTDKQIKKLKDRNENIGLALVALVLVLLIGKMNKVEQTKAENKNIVNHGSVPYWMQK